METTTGRRLSGFYLHLSLALCLLAVLPARAAETALDRYVKKADPSYSYKLVDTIKAPGATAYILEMTSQTWLTTNEVNLPQWRHYMTVVRPDQLSGTTGFLMIGGGSNDKGPPKPDMNLARLAIETKSVITELRMVPSQPLTFAGETKGRSEDSLIAYTWDKYLRTGDEKWPARLPMTKSAVRAMDTITSFCASDTGGKVKVESFVVGGASKRGWTTWTTAAVDKRVVAIIPIVIDMLNVEPSFMHHYAAYGFWAPAVGDYTAFNIMDWNGTPQYRALMRIEEPYEYRDRLTMPKFIINASGDQFFLPDSSQYYFKDLLGVKYLRYIPNADHSLKGSDVWETVRACYESILKGSKLPQFSWELAKDGSIRVKTTDQPAEVKLWQATNAEARDFRLMTIGPGWKSSSLTATGGEYVARVEKPAKGWTAFFVELTYPSGSPSPYKFTTDVRVLPDVTNFKFEPKPVK
jgi:PhoPQ-activated pathogenicity-related protein